MAKRPNFAPDSSRGSEGARRRESREDDDASGERRDGVQPQLHEEHQGLASQVRHRRRGQVGRLERRWRIKKYPNLYLRTNRIRFRKDLSFMNQAGVRKSKNGGDVFYMKAHHFLKIGIGFGITTSLPETWSPSSSTTKAARLRRG